LQLRWTSDKVFNFGAFGPVTLQEFHVCPEASLFMRPGFAGKHRHIAIDISGGRPDDLPNRHFQIIQSRQARRTHRPELARRSLRDGQKLRGIVATPVSGSRRTWR
jgi:hypothetical protein